MPEEIEEVEEKPKKVKEKPIVKGSVKDKIAGIEKQAREFEAAVRKFNADTKALAGGWNTYTKDDFEKSVAEFHAAIQKQTVENDAAMRKINVAVKELQRGIKATAGEFKTYSKEFWG